jgi:ribosomal-protein-alanine N-acetyltransferase
VHFKSVLPHIKSNQPILKTNRLILNAFTQADVPQVTAICSKKAIADTTAHIPHPYTEKIANEWIHTHALSFNKKSSVTYAIRGKQALDLIGCMSLVIDPVSDRGELGYWIREAAWNKGYCTEAAQVIIPFGFNTLQFNKLKAEHLIRNPASGKVLQKLGFKKEGVLKEHFKKWGIYEHIAVYGLCRSDYTP